VPAILVSSGAVAQIALPVAVAWTLAALFWFVLPLDKLTRSIVVAVLFPVMLVLPLFVPSDHLLWRGGVAIACSAPWLKLYDLHCGRNCGAGVPSFREHLLFQLNPCALVARRLVDEPRPPAADSVRRLARGTIDLILAGAGLSLVFPAARLGWPFWLEHVVKATLTFAGVYGAFEMLTAIWRLAGSRTLTVMERFYLARTPAEFWRRYNRHVSQFILEDIIDPIYPSIGIGAATVIAFALSGMLHDYLLFMATGRARPYLTTFFVVHGLGVVATYRLRPRGRWVAVWIAGTWAFSLATSLVYFAGVNQMIQWYASRNLPVWMPHR